MRNNKGFGKFEVLTVIVVLLAVFAYLGYTLTKQPMSKKLETMKNNAITFSRIVMNNANSFHSDKTVYLDEVYDEELSKKIRNPFGEGYCSASESKTEYDENTYYVTFQCDHYLIEHTSFSGNNDVTFYEVGDWKETKTNDDDEEKVLYNCLTSNVERYAYGEELYIVSRVNKDFNRDYYSISSIKEECDVVQKTFYRTKKEYVPEK